MLEQTHHPILRVIPCAPRLQIVIGLARPVCLGYTCLDLLKFVFKRLSKAVGLDILRDGNNLQ